MERQILVGIFQLKYVDHLQRWYRIFRSEETETDLSIWIPTEISGIFGIMESTLYFMGWCFNKGCIACLHLSPLDYLSRKCVKIKVIKSKDANSLTCAHRQISGCHLPLLKICMQTKQQFWHHCICNQSLARVCRSYFWLTQVSAGNISALTG